MAISPDPRDIAAAWDPQFPGRMGPSHIRDAIVEPDWGGLRVAVALTGTTAAAYCPGTEVRLPVNLRRALEAAAGGAPAVVEGNLTTAAFDEREAMVPPAPDISKAAMFIPRFGKSRKDDPYVHGRHRMEQLEAEAPAVLAALAAGERHAFVATDLLWLDGQALEDIPLLERKRLLDSLLAQSDLVRVTTFVKPTAKMTLVGWGALGFEELSWKAANSRYLRGEENPDWAIVGAPVSKETIAAHNAGRPLG